MTLPAASAIVPRSGIGVPVSGCVTLRVSPVLPLKKWHVSNRTTTIGSVTLPGSLAGLGDSPAALDWLERGVRAHPFHSVFIGTEPLFAPLRSEPRFQELLRIVGPPR